MYLQRIECPFAAASLFLMFNHALMARNNQPETRISGICNMPENQSGFQNPSAHPSPAEALLPLERCRPSSA